MLSFCVVWQFTFFNMSFVNIFSHSVGGHCTLLVVSSLCRTFVVWLFLCIFASIPLAWGDISKKYYQDQCWKAYCICCLLEVLWFHVLHLSLSFIWIYFCAWCEVVVQLDYFVCSSPYFKLNEWIVCFSSSSQISLIDISEKYFFYFCFYFFL